MALRIKSQWFRDAAPKSEAQNASVVAFTIWRVAQQALKQMRTAGFDIDAGPDWFAFLREWLVFLVQVADRIAYATLEPQRRVAFTTALVLRLAGLVDENERDLLGAAAGDAPGDAFVEQCNVIGGYYAEFGFGADGPDFGFLRYLGSRLEPVVPEKDRRWVLDHAMAIEAPEAVALVRRAIDGVYGRGPKRERRPAMSGE